MLIFVPKPLLEQRSGATNADGVRNCPPMSMYRSPGWEFPANPTVGEVHLMIRSLRKPELYKFARECLDMSFMRKSFLKARILGYVLPEITDIVHRAAEWASMLRGLKTLMYQQRDSTSGRRAPTDFYRRAVMDNLNYRIAAGLPGPGGAFGSSSSSGGYIAPPPPPRLPDRDFICNICNGGCSYPRCRSCGTFTHHACASMFARLAVRECLICRLTRVALKDYDYLRLHVPPGSVLHHACPLYMAKNGQISTLRQGESEGSRILSESIRIPSTDEGRIFLVRSQATLSVCLDDCCCVCPRALALLLVLPCFELRACVRACMWIDWNRPLFLEVFNQMWVTFCRFESVEQRYQSRWILFSRCGIKPAVLSASRLAVLPVLSGFGALTSLFTLHHG